MDVFRIDGQRAVLTGGGSGLGLGIARVFVEAGADVVIISLPSCRQRASV